MIIQNNGTPVEPQPILNFTNATSVTADRDEARIDVVMPAGEGGGVTMSQVYPVGSIYLSVVSTNPGTLLGVGTWTAFAAGRMLVGLNSGDTDFDTVEETGGAKTSTALLAHSHGVTDPGHNHTQDAHTHTQDSHNHTQDAHTHTQNAHTHVQDAHLHTISMGTTDGAAARSDAASSAQTTTTNTGSTTAVNQNATAVNQNATATNQAATATNQNATATNQSNTTGLTVNSEGSGASFSILNPYIVVYMWKRTA
jgi:hypothetical protein